MYATNYFENLMLNVARQQNITAPSTMYLALYQSNPSDTGTGGRKFLIQVMLAKRSPFLLRRYPAAG